MWTTNINFWAVLAAAIAEMAIGFVWYSPMAFGRSWTMLADIKNRRLGKINIIIAYFALFIGSLITSYVLALFIVASGAYTVYQGAEIGFWAWLGFATTTNVLDYIFSYKPGDLYAINMLYYLLSFLIMGIILSMWV